MTSVCCDRHLPATLLIAYDLVVGQSVIAYGEGKKIAAFTLMVEETKGRNCLICEAPSKWRVSLPSIKKVKETTLNPEKSGQATSEHADRSR
jgi:hypothetical protein